MVESGDLISVRKVVSHGDLQQATGPLEDWAYWHNHLTDVAADQVNQRRTAEFWGLWTGLQQALSFHRKLHAAILLVLLKTSRLAASAQTVAPRFQQLDAAPLPVPPVPSQWCVPSKLVKRYGQQNLGHLHRWWMEEGRDMLQGDSPLVFISGLQLFFCI